MRREPERRELLALLGPRVVSDHANSGARRQRFDELERAGHPPPVPAIQRAMQPCRNGRGRRAIGARKREQATVALGPRLVDIDASQRDSAMELVEQAGTFRKQVLERDLPQFGEALAHAADCGAVGVPVIDECVVEVEQDGADHARPYAASRLAFFRSCSLRKRLRMRID